MKSTSKSSITPHPSSNNEAVSSAVYTETSTSWGRSDIKSSNVLSSSISAAADSIGVGDSSARSAQLTDSYSQALQDISELASLADSGARDDLSVEVRTTPDGQVISVEIESRGQGEAQSQTISMEGATGAITYGETVREQSTAANGASSSYLRETVTALSIQPDGSEKNTSFERVGVAETSAEGVIRSESITRFEDGSLNITLSEELRSTSTQGEEHVTSSSKSLSMSAEGIVSEMSEQSNSTITRDSQGNAHVIQSSIVEYEVASDLNTSSLGAGDLSDHSVGLQTLGGLGNLGVDELSLTHEGGGQATSFNQDSGFSQVSTHESLAHDGGSQYTKLSATGSESFSASSEVSASGAMEGSAEALRSQFEAGFFALSSEVEQGLSALHEVRALDEVRETASAAEAEMDMGGE